MTFSRMYLVVVHDIDFRKARFFNYANVPADFNHTTYVALKFNPGYSPHIRCPNELSASVSSNNLESYWSPNLLAVASTLENFIGNLAFLEVMLDFSFWRAIIFILSGSHC
jgi:hypothetical protein